MKKVSPQSQPVISQSSILVKRKHRKVCSCRVDIFVSMALPL